MNQKIQYLFYLQPYTFIFSGIKKMIVYNSVNGKYIEATNNAVKDILKELQIPDKGYCVTITKEQARNREIISWIRSIRNSFSGDIIPVSFVDKKPFIIPPILRLYNNVEAIKKEGGQGLGEVILRNVNEVTFYLPGDCNKNCINCYDYNKQFNHCCNYKEKALVYNDYQSLFNNLDACGVNKVNFVINDFNNPIFQDIWENRGSNNFKKKYIFNIRNLSEEVISLFSVKDGLCIYVDNSYPTENLDKFKSLTVNLNIQWIHIIEDEKDMVRVDFSEKTSIVPFFNKQNLALFENNVYITMDDLLESPIEKQTIFRRQALNENFFGKIFILPSGEAFSNMNGESLGNLKKVPLGQVVYNEFNDSKSWLLTRDAKTGNCFECQNRYLCPSISNYEMVIGKTNLCHMSP